MDLAGYSARAQAFAIELARLYYRQFAGLEAPASMSALYDRSAELFTAGAVQSLREAQEAADEQQPRRRLRVLLRFAVDGHLGRATAALEASLVQREGALRVSAPGGAAIRLGDVAGAQAREADPSRRAELETQRCRLVGESLAPIAAEIVAARHVAARALGWPTYAAMYGDVTGIDFGVLRDQAECFLAATEPGFAAILDPAVRDTPGLAIGALRRADLPRLFRQPAIDDCFPAERLSETLADTLAGLGIDLAAQDNIVLDLAPRAAKSRRAFCAPVRVPEEIYLVLAAAGGWEDYAALLHEAGHAEHLAFAAPELPFELRRFGDPAVGEAFAFLFERIADEPAWLRSRGVEGASDAVAQARRLLFLRRYAAKLCYELELHGGRVAIEGASRLYAERLSAALHVDWPQATWLTDLDPGLYVAHYLRAWALEAPLRASLARRFGPDWFRSAAAGATLRALVARQPRAERRGAPGPRRCRRAARLRRARARVRGRLGGRGAPNAARARSPRARTCASRCDARDLGPCAAGRC